ncbi:Ger(x)C family spore germination protein [Paenibacillus lycopersici]|uniref:Ger(X)C family spore germination protein n=1 Tax=Paenibacillus lycopersici TaxID=2704462 RepID=A0A6C0FVN8_9BACL|nr:Ger(x)C family spore germination protein [Paenibacillus lycopersici]QHT59531.1 Ger(x)C family spore germination protein [Paenibacillus lycopersici]
MKGFQTVIRFFACAALLLALTGCWDRVEIDKRGFVVGVALDTAEQTGSSEKEDVPGTKIRGTFQFIVPSGLKSSSGSAGSGSAGARRSYFNLAVEESNMAALTAMLSSRTSRSPYYEHLKLIIISKAIASNDSMFSDVLDFFLRGKEMRRDMHVLVTDGKASDLMRVTSLNENYPVSYIESTISNTDETSYILPSSRLGDVHEHLLKPESFTIQRVRLSGGSITLTGAALFDGSEHKMIGTLNGENTQGLNFLMGQVKGGILETAFKNTSIAIAVEDASRKIKLAGDDGERLKFTVKISCDGTLIKSTLNTDLLDKAQTGTLEKLFESEIEKIAQKTIRTLQQKYKKDAMGLGSFMYQNHYRKWKRFSAEWETGRSLFAKADIEVKANVKLRRIGDINRAEEE